MTFIEELLERLQTAAEETVGLLGAMAASSPTNYLALRRNLLYGPKRFKKNWAEWYREYRRFHNLLYRLKRDGLVRQEKKSGARYSRWNITKKGRRKLTQLKKHGENPFALRHVKRYVKQKGEMLMLIIFDIPERDKRKREWLRAVLRRLGFVLLQKSVWIGQQKIPEDFIKDLRRHKLLPYIHIFSINKRGSLSDVLA